MEFSEGSFFSPELLYFILEKQTKKNGERLRQKEKRGSYFSSYISVFVFSWRAVYVFKLHETLMLLASMLYDFTDDFVTGH